MAFDGLEIAAIALADFGVPVLVTLSGTTVKTVTGILDLDPVTVSPGEMEMVQIEAALSLAESDFENITSANRFTVRGKVYRMQGKPRTNDGLVYIPLSVQK